MTAAEKFSEAWNEAGPQAFPSAFIVPPQDNLNVFVAPGLTKREWFAGMALQALLADYSWNPKAIDEAAKLAVAMANALIERLKQP